MKTRRTAFIPIVELGSKFLASSGNTRSRLLEVYSEQSRFSDALSDGKARDKNWDPIIAPLLPHKLYPAGLNAVGKVRKFGLKKPFAAFYQWFKPQAWIEQQRLRCADGQGPTEGSSAELGLALALLMGAAGSKEMHVIATGRLAPKLAGEALHNKDFDVKIYPVGSLLEKLRLVRELANAGKLPGAPLRFFIPDTGYAAGNTAVPVREHGEMQQLITELAALNVQVIPIAWLSEAANILKIGKARVLFLDQMLRGLLAVSIIVLAGWSSYVWWRDRPIELVFLPDGEGPFIACVKKLEPRVIATFIGYYDKAVKPAICNYEPCIPTHSVLAWKLKAGSNTGVDAELHQRTFFDGYYVAQIMLSEKSPHQILIPHNVNGEPKRIVPGTVWESGFGLNDVEELNAMVLLAQRHEPFNQAELRTALEKMEQKSIPSLVDFTAQLAPASEYFVFHSKKQLSLCEE